MSGTRTRKERVLISFDYALKRLLRNKANYDVLEGFLSELLMRDIRVNSIAESESNRENATDKHNRVDILIEDEKGELLIVELQFTLEMDYFHRMLYGAGNILVERMKQGEKYLNLRKVFSINIVYFDLGQGEDYIYHGKTIFRGLHANDVLQLSEVQRKMFGAQEAGVIYPEYYILTVNHFNDVAMDTLDEWIYFLKNNSIRDEFTARGLDRARAVLEYDRLSPEERAEYDRERETFSHSLSMMASSRDEAEFKIRNELEPIIAEKDAIITEKDAVIARERAEKEEKDAIIARERAEKEEKDAIIARERAEKEALLAELTALKNNR
ncbi:MAG: Rpn family recombination-promoting nuclease/putative transposase [Tannerella sp.]|jgi:predicted transposase/invertase (TIGR01784 family)|nr:Rpn family recombination-promoting nuclease/putative transposase [Tannerella sp.]